MASPTAIKMGSLPAVKRQHLLAELYELLLHSNSNRSKLIRDGLPSALASNKPVLKASLSASRRATPASGRASYLSGKVLFLLPSLPPSQSLEVTETD